MKILHLAESGAFGMERIIEHGKRVVAAVWFVKWGYYRARRKSHAKTNHTGIPNIQKRIS